MIPPGRAAVGATALLIVPVVYSLAFPNQKPDAAKPAAYFTDKAATAGLTMEIVSGGVDKKK